MSRFLFVVLALFLAACSSQTPVLVWLSPTAEGTLTGQTRLSVEPLTAESAPPNVVFSFGNREVGKAYLEDGHYEMMFDTTTVKPGSYTLSATPYGGASTQLAVSVARQVPGGTTDSVIGDPDAAPKLDLGDDPLSLDGLLDLVDPIADGPTSDALENAPGGFPWGSLWGEVKVQAMRNLFTQQTEVVELPRGEYSYDEELGEWQFEARENAPLVIRFDYEHPETGPHDILITVSWEQGSPVEIVRGALGQVEVPTAARISVLDNEELILDLDFGATWRDEGACGPVLEPTELSLIGYTAHERPETGEGELEPEQEEGDAPERPEIDASDLELLFTLEDTPLGEETLNLELGLVTLAGSAQADLSLELSAVGTVERKDCAVAGGEVSELTLASEVGIGLEDGPRKGSRFNVAASEPVYNDDGLPTSGVVTGELGSFDEETGEEELTTYDGTFDETNGDGFPGENVEVIPFEGEATTLDVYIRALVEAYQALIEEKIAELEAEQ